MISQQLSENGRKMRLVIRSDGQVFQSLRMAAESVGGNPTALGQICRGEYKGFTWHLFDADEKEKLAGEFDGDDTPAPVLEPSNPLWRFVKKNCHEIEGGRICFKDFKVEFFATLDDKERATWLPRKVRSELEKRFPVGNSSGHQLWIGNLSFTQDTPCSLFILENDRLKRRTEDQH